MKLQDLMMLYGVTLGARHTKRQRYLFATQMKEALTEHGWDYEVQTNPKGKNGFCGSLRYAHQGYPAFPLLPL